MIMDAVFEAVFHSTAQRKRRHCVHMIFPDSLGLDEKTDFLPNPCVEWHTEKKFTYRSICL